MYITLRCFLKRKQKGIFAYLFGHLWFPLFQSFTKDPLHSCRVLRATECLAIQTEPRRPKDSCPQGALQGHVWLGSTWSPPPCLWGPLNIFMSSSLPTLYSFCLQLLLFVCVCLLFWVLFFACIWLPFIQVEAQEIPSRNNLCTISPVWGEIQS